MSHANNTDPATSPLHFFGAELRRLRVRDELTQEQLGQRVNYSRDLIGAIEAGRRKPQPDLLNDLDGLFGTDGLLGRMWDFLRRELYPSWLRPWIEAEREARTLKSWEPLVVPGLLQTADYARELIRVQPGTTEERIEEQVAARLERQAILDRDEPPLLWVLLGESVLRHYQVGSPTTMRAQLQTLIEAAERPHVTVQVVPLSAGMHPGNVGAFAIASYDGTPDVVYLDSARSGQVTDRAEDVQAMTDMYDAIRAQALPADASLDLITKVMEQWI